MLGPCWDPSCPGSQHALVLSDLVAQQELPTAPPGLGEVPRRKVVGVPQLADVGGQLRDPAAVNAVTRRRPWGDGPHRV